jgi:hypothetical protein
MSTAVVDEFVKQARMNLTSDELRDLSRRLNEADVKTDLAPKSNGKKGYVSPNTIWLRDHSAPYQGMHVAVKDGEFIGARPSLKELDLHLRDLGVDRALRAYVPREEDLFWGGW